ncbi:MAG: N-formylglutamate amidohydrolase [Salaquimonas sp.]
MPDGFSPYEIVSGDLSKGLLLLCDHARNDIPLQYGNLGMAPEELSRHIAYDIGAEGIFRGLAQMLGAPGIMTTYSRLLIDPNRGEDDPTLVRQLYDGFIIPGNYPLSKEELESRMQIYFRPYHDAIDELLRQFDQLGVVPMIVSVHSMTDQWNGERRPWEISILWDKDPRLAEGLLAELGSVGEFTVGDNQPYDGALGGDTMHTHCTCNGLSHALLEFRQDLVADQTGIEYWVKQLAPIIEKLNKLPHNHEKKWFGSRSNVKC